MICPFCSNKETKVLDKRDNELMTKRRRECLKCKRRFNTVETAAKTTLRVIKKDGGREVYDPDKMRRGIMRACEKRPVSTAQIEKLALNVEDKIRKNGKEIKSSLI